MFWEYLTASNYDIDISITGKILLKSTEAKTHFLSEVSTVHQFVYTDEALPLVRQSNFQPTRIQELEYTNQTAHH